MILSPYFPPSTLAGVHRARHMVKHLPAFGWDPILIRVDPNCYTEAPDPGLEELVAAEFREFRVNALSATLTRKIGIGDLGLRALPYLVRAMDAAITRERPDAVFLTGAPFYPLLISQYIKRRHDVAVVVDLQDPWASNYGASQPFFSKRRMANRVATILEPLALRAADAITSVSETQNDELRARYSFLANRPMEAIPIGGDPEDFDTLRLRPPVSSSVQLDPSKINLNYVGTFLPRAAPLARVLFRGLKALTVKRPDLTDRLRLNFIGTSNQPAHTRATPVTDLARTEGVDHLVFEISQRVPYLEALALLANAHGLLMIGSDEPHYTASKIYPNLMAGRPYLSLFHASSSSHRILSEAGGGIALAFDSSAALENLGCELERAIEKLATDAESLGEADQAAYAPYTAYASAGRYAALFAALASGAMPVL